MPLAHETYVARKPEPRLTDQSLFLTAATVHTNLRRGDPLGFRAVADLYADILAPGLTNRTWDARWLTLLCWSMVQVDEVRRELRLGHGLEDLELRRHVYAWLRPLELTWVAQAVRLAERPSQRDGRQLPGRRAIERSPSAWAREGFGLSRDQYQRYRFTGAHGAYRSLLGSLSGMTVDGDGHRPGPMAERLAEAVSQVVPAPRQGRLKKGAKPPPEAHWAAAWAPATVLQPRVEKWLPSLAHVPRKLVAGEAIEDGVDPVSWSPPRCWERIPRCRSQSRRTQTSTASRSSGWPGQDGLTRA